MILPVLYVRETWSTLAEECRLRVKGCNIEGRDVCMVGIERVTLAFTV